MILKKMTLSMLEKTKRDPLLHQQHQKESFFIADALGFALHLHLLFLSTRTEVDQNYIKKQLWMGVQCEKSYIVENVSFLREMVTFVG